MANKQTIEVMASMYENEYDGYVEVVVSIKGREPQVVRIPMDLIEKTLDERLHPSQVTKYDINIHATYDTTPGARFNG